jgi:Uma2 family endonuclease
MLRFVPRQEREVQLAHAARHKLGYDDLVRLPDDGLIRELLDGVLVVSPSRAPNHQRVVLRLARQLQDYVEQHRLGELFVAPLDVILGPHDVLEPDLLVVTDSRLTTERAIEGPPALVIEVLSPSSAARDRVAKAHRYAAGGVPHFWLVDIERRRIECLRLEGGCYRVVAEHESDGTLAHPEWPGLAVDLAALWRQRFARHPL